VANLYYNHPILNILAHDFDVTYERVSVVPTVMQAGYAAGLLFLCPLGDVFRRRAYVLILVWFTATVVSPRHILLLCLKADRSKWLGLCLTKSFPVFVALSFITAVTTVTPQLMLPLVGDLAPPAKRAQSLSIVVSAMMLGILLARVLSGVVTQYTSWRNIYWLSFGLQYLIVVLLWFFMPDYPSVNPGGLNYFKMLWSIVVLLFKYPVLLQAGLIGFLDSSVFTSYWTTLTFLLSSSPYNYDSLVIGLFAFIGIGAMVIGPFYSRHVIDRYIPLFAVLLGQFMCITGVAIGTYTGTFTVAGPIIQAFLVDLGLQTTQIANRSSIYVIEPKARNRVNTAFMVCVFCGQLMGTAVGNRLFAKGGWVASGSASLGFVVLGAVVCLLRGPREKGWVGWGGGWNLRRDDISEAGDAVKAGLDERAAEEREAQTPELSIEGKALNGEDAILESKSEKV
jgi:predicted MFS family arabinose efflux permease